MDFKPLLTAIIVFAAIDLIFTAVAVGSAMPGEAQGGLRSIDSIPPKILQLLSVGLVLGVASIISLRRLNMDLVLAGLILTPLLDLDHLPIMLGIPQPIRPSHSYLFMTVAALAIYLLLKRLDLSLMASSSTMIHLAADTSSFPLLSPLTLRLYNVDATADIVLAAAAIFTAFLSGYAARRQTTPLQTPNGDMLSKHVKQSLGCVSRSELSKHSKPRLLTQLFR